jgi:4-hydroxybenzoate polyprenyltransferase
VLVSLLVVAVLGVLLLSELETIESVPNQNFKIIIVTISISLFLFNLIREIVKDIEDISGDQQHEVVSLPILIGIKNTKTILRAALALSIFPLLYLGINFSYGAMGYTLTIFAIVLTFRNFTLVSAREGLRASLLSKNLKLIMLAGILLMGFLTVL